MGKNRKTLEGKIKLEDSGQLSLFNDKDFERSNEDDTSKKEAKIIYFSKGVRSKYKPGTSEYYRNNPHFVSDEEIAEISKSESWKEHVKKRISHLILDENGNRKYNIYGERLIYDDKGNFLRRIPNR